MLFDSLGVALIAIVISLVVVGIPAAVMKATAGRLFAPGRDGLISRSIARGALVGIAVIVLEFVIAAIPAAHSAAEALGGWGWTTIAFAVLGLSALVVDWHTLQPLSPRLPAVRTVGFLVVSNLWVVAGAFLLLLFNGGAFFQSCFDPATKRVVDTFSESRPATCEELPSDD
jgi:hypothetical protein